MSLDQMAAEKFGASTRFGSLQLCAGDIQSQRMVFTREDVPLPMINRPSVVIHHMFATGENRVRREYLRRSGKSTLDVVKEEANRLNTKISKSDRRKLAEYFSSLRQLERRTGRQLNHLADDTVHVDYTLPPFDSVAPTLMLECEQIMFDMMALAWLNATVIKHSPIGGITLRTLSRREYGNTIRHVSNLENFESPHVFPPDNTAERFDNQGEELVVAFSHIEALADTASAGKNFRRHATWPARFEAPANDKYAVKVTVSALHPPAETPLLDKSEFLEGRRVGDSLKTLTISSQQPKRYRFDVDLDRGHSLVFRYRNGPFDCGDKKTYPVFLTDLFAKDLKLAAAWAKVGAPARGGSGWQRVVETMETAELDVEKFSSGSDNVNQLIRRIVANAVRSGEPFVYRFFENGPAVCIHQVEISGPVTLYPDADNIRVQ